MILSQANAFRRIGTLGCITVAMLVGMAAPTPDLLAQPVPNELRVRELLRSVLGVGANDTLYVTRDYVRSFFPQATFFRTVWRSSGADMPAQHAAVVARGDSAVIVAGFNDLGNAWDVAATESLPPLVLGPACFNLMVQTGLLSTAATILRSRSSLGPEVLQRLEHSRALRNLAPAESGVTNGLQWARFAVWDPERGVWPGIVARFECNLSRQRVLSLQVDTLAAAPTSGR